MWREDSKRIMCLTHLHKDCSTTRKKTTHNAQTTHLTGKRENLGTRLTSHIETNLQCRCHFFCPLFRSTTLTFTTNPYNLYTNYANKPTCLPVQLKVVQT